MNYGQIGVGIFLGIILSTFIPEGSELKPKPVSTKSSTEYLGILIDQTIVTDQNVTVLVFCDLTKNTDTSKSPINTFVVNGKIQLSIDDSYTVFATGNKVNKIFLGEDQTNMVYTE